ncbi:MAG: metal ABC transporter permease [bacterium]
MSEFFEVLWNQPFMQHAFLTGILASLACGVIGSYVVVKRIVFISGGISHSVLAGMGLACYLGYPPLPGAVLFALFSALLIGIISLRTRQREDTIIGAVWAVGMAAGLIFISLTPGYNADLMSYLFGNILMVSREDLLIISALDLLIFLLVFLFHKQFLAVCFDEEYARLQGVRVDAVYLLLLCLIALTIVVLIQVTGIILVLALLTLPAASASHYARSLLPMMIIATGVGMVCTSAGLFLSYEPNLPTGAAIVMTAGVIYLISTVVHALWLFRQRRQHSRA